MTEQENYTEGFTANSPTQSNSNQEHQEHSNEVVKYPQKRFYRQRAHSNPMSDHDLDYPISPEKMDWNCLFGPTAINKLPEFVDIGCGYGGLLIRLSPMFPNITMVGMEIRLKVSDFVQERIKALRAQTPGKYDNVCCMRSNAMKNLPNFFYKAQLSKMFFLFPDPHFKKSKYKWRIISTNLLAEYAYVLKPGGLIYTITDVQELHNWMVEHIEMHPLFRRLSEIEIAEDPIVPLLYESTEEGQKVTRNSGQKWSAVFQRVENP